MQKTRLGVVSYLNSRPLIYGLEGEPSVSMRFEVPSRLAMLLDEGEVDVALVPVVDLVQSGRDWRLVSDACIGSDGETFTVRVFSRVPPAQITRMHVDGDSHTSVALADVIWSRHFGRELSIVSLEQDTPLDECEAILLIGDKVIRPRLIDLDIETDLGSAWKSMTGLPFVFAVWAGIAGRDTSAISEILRRARDLGVSHVDEIAERIAPTMGWPVELARRYLGRRLQYRLTPRHQEGMRCFLEMVRQRRRILQGSQGVLA